MGIPGGAGRGPRIRRVPSSQLGYASPLPRYTHPDRGVCPDLRSYLLGDILSIALRDGNRGVAHRCRGYGGAFRHVCDLPGSSSRQYVGRSDVGASIAQDQLRASRRYPIWVTRGFPRFGPSALEMSPYQPVQPNEQRHQSGRFTSSCYDRADIEFIPSFCASRRNVA